MSDDIVARLREQPLTKTQQRRAIELLQQCLEAGTIAKGYPDREPRRCLGDEVEEFLEKVGNADDKAA